MVNQNNFILDAYIEHWNDGIEQRKNIKSANNVKNEEKSYLSEINRFS